MEILVGLIVIGVLGYWLWSNSRRETTKIGEPEAPYKVETVAPTSSTEERKWEESVANVPTQNYPEPVKEEAKPAKAKKAKKPATPKETAPKKTTAKKQKTLKVAK